MTRGKMLISPSSKGARSKQQMSRVSNGRKWLETVDGRSRLARRAKDILADLTGDLDHQPSAVESHLLRQSATLIACSEVAAARVLNGQNTGTDALNEITRLAHAITRNLVRL